jgi:hypothetical protein
MESTDPPAADAATTPPSTTEPTPQDSERALVGARAHARSMLLGGATVAQVDAALAGTEAHGRSPQSIVDEVHAELLAARDRLVLPPSGTLRGIAGALVGAIVAAAAWAALMHYSGYEIGFAAIGIGFLVAEGALKLTGGRSNQALFVSAILLTLASFVAGRYLTVWAQVHDIDSSVGPFAQPMRQLFLDHPSQFFEAIDLLWVGFALSVVVRRLRPVGGHIAPPRSAPGSVVS